MASATGGGGGGTPSKPTDALRVTMPATATAVDSKSAPAATATATATAGTTGTAAGAASPSGLHSPSFVSPAATAAYAAKQKARSQMRPEQWEDSLFQIKNTNKKLVIVLVGLPARGKTYIGKKLARWLSWLGYLTKVFNIGDYRRALAAADTSGAFGSSNADFFNPNNPKGAEARNRFTKAALDDLISFLFTGGGHIALFDGTNVSRERRRSIVKYLSDSPITGEILWIESVCDDKSILTQNIKDTKLYSPDYKGWEPKRAAEDFKRRIAYFESVYEHVSEDELGFEESFVRIHNSGQRVKTFKIHGYLPSKIVFYLMNLKISQCPVFLSRHGESEYNLTGKVGGNSPLSERGRAYGALLGQFISDPIACPDAQPLGELALWTSTLLRTRQTCGLVRESSLKAAAAAAAAAASGVTSPFTPGRSLSPVPSTASSVASSPAPIHSPQPAGFPFTPTAAASAAVHTTTALPAATATPLIDLKAPNPIKPVPRAAADSTTATAAAAAATATAAPTAASVLAANSIGPPTEWRALVEIEAGVFNGMTYAEIERTDPGDFEARTRDKLRYRYPHGESYTDVIDRLEIVIFELERITRPVLVIGHQAVLRCLYGYFLDLPQEKIPHLDVPLHTVIKLTPKAYGCYEERFALRLPGDDLTKLPKNVTAIYPPLPPDAESGNVSAPNSNDPKRSKSAAERDKAAHEATAHAKSLEAVAHAKAMLRADTKPACDLTGPNAVAGPVDAAEAVTISVTTPVIITPTATATASK